jgi:putative Mn2+ efflux pump MntP
MHRSITVFEVALLALALSADAFSVALAVGLKHSSPRQIFRLAWHFGLFQALMPFLGAFGGAYLLTVVGDVGPFVAFALLGAIGAKMLWDSGRVEEVTGSTTDPTRGWSLVGLSVATSIDAFGAGIGLALAQANLWISSIVIGVTAALVTLAAMLIGARLERVVGRWAERMGGLVLLGLAVRMLWL